MVRGVEEGAMKGGGYGFGFGPRLVLMAVVAAADEDAGTKLP